MNAAKDLMDIVPMCECLNQFLQCHKLVHWLRQELGGIPSHYLQICGMIL